MGAHYLGDLRPFAFVVSTFDFRLSTLDSWLSRISTGSTLCFFSTTHAKGNGLAKRVSAVRASREGCSRKRRIDMGAHYLGDLRPFAFVVFDYRPTFPLWFPLFLSSISIERSLYSITHAKGNSLTKRVSAVRVSRGGCSRKRRIDMGAHYLGDLRPFAFVVLDYRPLTFDFRFSTWNHAAYLHAAPTLNFSAHLSTQNL